MNSQVGNKMPVIERVHGYYRFSCPNCNSVNSDLRLAYKAPCDKCLEPIKFMKLKRSLSGKEYIDILRTYLVHVKEHCHLKKLYSFEEKLKEFEEFFAKATGGYRLWSAQRTWARRVLKRKSFSIIAPTGTGKTMFALITSLFISKNNMRKTKNRIERRKCYLVFPTTPLLMQADRKLRTLAEKAGIKICSEEENDENCLKIISVHGRISKKKREKYIEDLRNGDFDILLSTNMFFHKNYEVLIGKNFDFIVMDDVDAILRSNKAIRILFRVLGIDEEEIEKAIEYIRLRQRLMLRLSDEERKHVEKQLRELDKIVSRARKKIKAVVVVSSATGKPRGIYPRLFRVLLGFEAGSRAEAIRNIVDTYLEPEKSIEEEVLRLVKKLGDGGLVFVPIDKGIEYAENIATLLQHHGIKAEAFHSKKAMKLLDSFASGEIDILIGVATYYGVMVRGLDLPERVKYVIFAGIPRHKFSSRLESPRPVDVLRILSIIRDVLEGDEKRNIEILIGRLTLRLRRLSQGALQKLTEDFQKKLAGEQIEETPSLRMLIEALETARSLLTRRDVWEKIQKKGDVALVEGEGKSYILIPDTATYIQASGRTSRLYPGGITKGLSVIIVDDERLLNGLIKRMRWLFEDLEIKPLNEIDLEKLMEEISKEREKVKKILRGEIAGETIELSKSALLIVESPNKARTIANFFGKPSIRVLDNGMTVYDVTTGDYVLSIIASIGHIYDLVVDEGYHNYGILVKNSYFIPVYTDIKRCNDCGYQFTAETRECPKCGSRNITRKLDIVETLRELASEVDIVFIGTDPDTEGEKIGWDLKVLLEPYTREIKRIEFHEITRKAILNAIHNPREFDMRLIEAQIVRRIEDRWLGFALSQKLWCYFWPEYCRELSEKLLKRIRRGKIARSALPDCTKPNRNLSAGRVQTPVLGYIIDKYKKHQNPKNYGLGLSIGTDSQRLLVVELVHEEIERLGLKRPEEIIGRKVEVTEVKTYEDTVNPLPPFTTDTLLEEASMRLGLSSTRTMEIAQELFELGLITYHRTDSTRISDAGINIARQYLEEKYGEKYKEIFRPRTWGKEGAHEAIRPTRPIDADRLAELIREGAIVLARPLTRLHLKVYDLIFRRFIASQMIPAKVKKQEIVIRLDGITQQVERTIEIIKQGFNEVYRVVEPQPAITPGTYSVINAWIIRPPLARYHDVIKWMKEQGIGRPSTYAKIIQTLIDRKYVIVTQRIKAFVPMLRGIRVHEFLTKNFGDVVSVDVTRRLEEKMKEIEEGKRDYQEVLREIFRELEEKVINVVPIYYSKPIYGDVCKIE